MTCGWIAGLFSFARQGSWSTGGWVAVWLFTWWSCYCGDRLAFRCNVLMVFFFCLIRLRKQSQLCRLPLKPPLQRALLRRATRTERVVFTPSNRPSRSLTASFRRSSWGCWRRYRSWDAISATRRCSTYSTGTAEMSPIWLLCMLTQRCREHTVVIITPS